MKTFNVLSPGFKSPNSQAFLFPLIKWRSKFLENGIKINFHNKLNDRLYECDYLGIDNKIFSNLWLSKSEELEENLFKISQKNQNIYWFDITDSAGWDHAKYLKYVKAVVKNQVFKNKSLYLKPIYGNGRLYSDYYFSKFGIKDSNPSYSLPVKKRLFLKKIKVGWNSGLANYSLLGPFSTFLIGNYFFSNFLEFTKTFTSIYKNRSNSISCRYGIKYQRETVAYQRKRINEILKYNNFKKLNRFSYFKEIKNSKIILSPFGLGEITLKDFEVFLTGGLLIKQI